MTNLEAVKTLYGALGGTASDVADCTTIVEVLNTIAAMYEGDDNAITNPDAIANLAAVAGSITPEPTLENKTVTPTTAEQTITAGEGYDGLGTVTVNAVTAAIDENIVAGNIKSGVSILGVEGNVSDGNAEFIKDASTSFSFQGSIKKIIIPDGYTGFNSTPLSGATLLEDVTLPETFTAIANDCFRNCVKLKNINIPSGITTIGSSAFGSCIRLTNIDMPNTITSIGDGAFYGTGFTSIEIPNSVTSIGTNVFGNCTNLTTITVHKAEGSITGAPWGAPNATVVWTG